MTRGGARHRGVRLRRATALAIALSGTLATAQIRTDGTLGGPAMALPGPSFQISEALGRLAGSNLYHSFLVFNVGSGESATFATTTPGLANVVSRVTGGSASQINGQINLASTNAAPNFFFINPAGVVFGKGAEINVPAGFHVSTGNYIKFPDGKFYADPNVVSTLSSAAPEAFGFLGTTRAAITIKEGAFLQTASPDADQPISIVAGDIEINGAHAQTGGGDMRAIAVGSAAQEVGLTGVLPNAFGNLGIVNGGYLYSRSSGATKAGDVLVAAGSVLIDGGNVDTFTGLASEAGQPATGNAGSVTINATGTLSVVKGGQIDSSTFSAGNAGTVKVTAGDIVIDGQGRQGLTGISSDSAGGTGDAGNVAVSAKGRLSIVDAGKIFSSTSGSGNAGAVEVTAGEIVIDGAGGGRVTGIFTRALPSSTGSAGSIAVSASGALSIVNGGTIDSGTFSSGNAGAVKVTAGTLSLANDGTIASNTDDSSGNAGAVSVTAGDLDIDGRGGSFFTGIISASSFGTGKTGNVDVTTSNTLSIVNGGKISTSTYFSLGQAGTVEVTGSRLSMASGGAISSSTEFSLNGGAVKVTAGALLVASDSTISSNTYFSGNAGAVTVMAGDIVIDGQGGKEFTGIISQPRSGAGNAGSVDVSASGMLSIVNGGTIDSSTFSSGRAGTVKVIAGTLSMASAGTIGSNTDASSGNAGAVTVIAADIVIDGQRNSGFTGIFSRASTSATGNAGSVDVAASGTLSMVDGGRIDTSTFSSGQAGTVKVAAGEIVIDGMGNSGFTGITSQAVFGTGNAGSVDVTARGTLAFVNGGVISSSTGSSGQAGTVRVTAGTLSGDSNGFVGAVATPNSSGQTGTVSVQATDAIMLTNGASLSIRNGATVANPNLLTPTLLSVGAAYVTLTNSGQINAASSGNVAASNIKVDFGPQMTVSNARISTSANDGNGGSIRVAGTDVLVLQNGQITTSVAGTTGNGGDISIATPILVMQSGFVQANTAATDASGGNVNIEAGTLLPSGGTLFVGGPTPYAFAPGLFGFNVIQAAAPTGVSGSIRISTPVLDITGSLTGLPAQFLDAGGLGRSPCAIVGGSSLSQVGRGTLPPAAGDLLRTDAPPEQPAEAAARTPISIIFIAAPRPTSGDARPKTTACRS